MKNFRCLVLVVFSFLSAQSCAETKLVKCGVDWINLHKGNVHLTGIHVQSLPDGIDSKSDYKGRHPVMVIYVFNDSRAHTVTYTPSGQIQDGVWWDIPSDHWVKKSLVRDMRSKISCAYWK